MAITDEQLEKYKYGTEDTAGIIFFEEQIRTEQGKPLNWESWQRELWNDLFLTRDENGLRQYHTALVGIGKKNGKSFMAATLTAHQLLFCDDDAHAEVYGIAGDMDQAKIILRKTQEILKDNPDLAESCTFYRDAIETRAGGVYRVLAADVGFRTAHGLNPSAVIIDEAWVFQDDNPWTALTFSPVRKQPLYFVISYGGFEDNEEGLLAKLYKMGIEGSNPRMYFRWFEGEEGSYEGWKKANPASWVERDYLERQKRVLMNDSAFRRLHLCQFTASESQFLTRAELEACTDSTLRPIEHNKSLRIVLGIDASFKRDYTAVVAVTKIAKQRYRIVSSKVWKPTASHPIDFDEVERYIIELSRNFRLMECLFDPFQFANSGQRLQRLGIKMVEYPQTTANLTRSGSALYELVKERKLLTFDDDDLRRAVLNCAVKETERGFRIVKSGAGKIDAAVALSFALVGAESLPISNESGINSIHCIRISPAKTVVACPILGGRVYAPECHHCDGFKRFFDSIAERIVAEGCWRSTPIESVSEYVRRRPDASEGIYIASGGPPPPENKARHNFRYPKIQRG
jgi:phage terminase large subunit-like protein